MSFFKLAQEFIEIFSNNIVTVNLKQLTCLTDIFYIHISVSFWWELRVVVSPKLI